MCVKCVCVKCVCVCVCVCGEREREIQRETGEIEKISECVCRWVGCRFVYVCGWVGVYVCV